jgi:hypothetical protein
MAVPALIPFRTEFELSLGLIFLAFARRFSLPGETAFLFFNVNPVIVAGGELIFVDSKVRNGW